MKKITATAHTKLKKRPVDSIELLSREFLPVPKGKYYFVTKSEAAGNHTKVTLSHGAGTWFVFNDDWDGLRKSQPIKVNPNDIINSIRKSANSFGLTLKTQHAYIIATTFWETGRTFQPVKEAYWLSESWRRSNLRYFPYYGRGYVQLTWKFNYEKYSKILGLDLVNNPDKVMEPDISMFILCHGFKHGVFTGHSLEKHVNAKKTDFLNARRCINGVDKRREIAALANSYLKKLN